MTHTPISQIKVSLDFGAKPIPVGRLAIRDRVIYFEYEAEFLQSALNVSPFRLPLKPGLQSFENSLFEGLPGVFNDSLPDGWGRLLFDRSMRAQGIMPEQLSPLDRLAHIGEAGMGALVYEPDFSEDHTSDDVDLDWLAEQSREVLEGAGDDVLNALLTLNGSSAGARPKALIGYDRSQEKLTYGGKPRQGAFEPWLVKSANTTDGTDAGAIEFVYAEMARRAGLDVMETKLFPPKNGAKNGAGYFATKRFDRDGDKRFHMHTACGLLHSDFRTPSLDYQDLIALTTLLTRDVRETEKMFRLAVFNVFAQNRDDHSKNFSYLMNEDGDWSLSPAYDLTFSSGPGGEQSTMVMGEGKAPNIEHLRALGQNADIKEQTVNEIIDQTRSALADWNALAKEHGVTPGNVRLIADRMNP
jgi:serine/threonine-protein kinase HipA